MHDRQAPPQSQEHGRIAAERQESIAQTSIPAYVWKQYGFTKTGEMTHHNNSAGKNDQSRHDVLKGQPQYLTIFTSTHLEQRDAVQDSQKPLMDAIDVFQHEQATEYQEHAYKWTSCIEQGPQIGRQGFDCSVTHGRLLVGKPIDE